MFNFGNLKKKRTYLDYAAATPLRKEVKEVMEQYWSINFANPSSIHQDGVKAKLAIEMARENVAKTLRVRTDDIVFTSGGTESNNLVLLNLFEACSFDGKKEKMEIISTKVEHPSILETLKKMEERGVVVNYVPIDNTGRVQLDDLKKIISPNTKLVSIAYANSETGVVQDLNAIARVIKSFNKEYDSEILFHTDASQAPRWLSCALDSLGVDLMTLDAAKCEGPKGIGVLVKRSWVKLSSITYGGGQENNIRPGTEPVPLIVGASLALELAKREYEETSHRVSLLRDRFIEELNNIPEVSLNGSVEHRLANNVNISIPGFDTEFAVIFLDSRGVACSTKSACSGASGGYSKVVYEMTKDKERAKSTIRFSLSPNTKWKELEKTVRILKEFIDSNRKFINAK